MPRLPPGPPHVGSKPRCWEAHRGETEPGDRVAAQDAPLLLVGQAWNGRHHTHRLGELAVPVRVVGGVHDHMQAHGVEHVREDLLLGLTSESHLAAGDDLRGFALAEMPLRPQLLEVLVQPLGPRKQPATSSST